MQSHSKTSADWFPSRMYPSTTVMTIPWYYPTFPSRFRQENPLPLPVRQEAEKLQICSLLPRFYDVSSGRITIDGKDIRDLTLESLRNQIGIVQQDVYLFCGTIKENIAYGKPNASMDEIVDAARKANIHDFIESLPDGYDTFVGERGTRLSGGQKQRISIARVFLKNPPILILDEATSALDNESERWIQQSLEVLAKNRTTITIAHRLSTIQGADEILVIADNGIAERGTHEELIEKNGIYAHYLRA